MKEDKVVDLGDGIKAHIKFRENKTLYTLLEILDELKEIKEKIK